ncbi:MAG: hypothetical protein IPM91_08585 [Bacteroidetes bacterium]|nr:hypothetical protein [Bacteroidota bacterium]
MNANLVGSSSMPMLSSVGNALIPVFSSYTGCGDLQVPSIFEPLFIQSAKMGDVV